MKITINTNSYNEKRYGKPWIAVVDFSKTSQGEFHWGNWTGDSYNGGEGVLEIDADHGDIIARGQKDNRQPKNSAPNFYIVGTDGNLTDLGDKGAAYKHFLSNRDKKPNMEALRSEREKLVSRIAEIDAILNQ